MISRDWSSERRYGGPDGPVAVDEMADLYPEMDEPAMDLDLTELMPTPRDRH